MGQPLSYGELNARANQLAWKMREDYEVGPDRIVGLLVERSIEMVVGILGILKAGGAYLPIDPEYPRERIKYMLEDSACDLLLTQGRFVGTMSFSGDTIDLEECKTLQRRSAGNLPSRGSSSDLAYVIYTSGSTGKPNGVLVEHRNVMNTLNYLESEYPLVAGDAYLLKTTYTFDVSVSELFGWFMGEGRLVGLDPDAEKEPFALARIFHEG